MTYCAGWKYADSVYLLADTAVTKLTTPTTKYSSFGELHTEVRGEHIEEALLKLIPIRPGAAVAFAGDVEMATYLVDFLKHSYDHASNSIELLSWLTTSGPFDRKRPVELLLATSSAGKTELLHWDTVQGFDTTASDYYQIGSLTSYHAALTPNLISRLVAGNLAPDRLLAIITAVVQSYGVHDNLMDMNVGGLIFGLRVHDGSVTWQDDTNFVLYDRTVGNTAYISALVRDDALVLHSSMADGIRVFAHSGSTPSLSAWFDTWSATVKHQLDSGVARYWVFISTAAKVITLICRDNLERESRFVRVTALGDGRFDMALSPELMSLLMQPLDDRGDGSMPFRLNVRND